MIIYHTPSPPEGGTPPILRGERHAECTYNVVPSENAMVYTNLSCFNGSIKLHSPLKIGGVPQKGGEGV